MPIQNVIVYIRNHRCYSHPIFEHWARINPGPEIIGALFHQIQCFCASTRPGWSFPAAVNQLGMPLESRLLQEIVDSEVNDGPALATMAGYIVNLAAKVKICPDLHDQAAVERTLKYFSDHLLGNLPGYDRASGLTLQTRKAISVFERRKLGDRESTWRNFGTALALEMISNQQLIPGEKLCLVDSSLYGASMRDPEMRYLLEHWGEVGAEQQHECKAVTAVASVIDTETEPFIMEGARDFLDSLAALWDLLDSALLGSGVKPDMIFAARAA